MAGVVHANSTLDAEIRHLPGALNEIKQALENFRAKQVGKAQAILHTAQSDADKGLEKLQPQDIEERFFNCQPELLKFSIELRKKNIESDDAVYQSRVKNYADFRQKHQRQYSAYHFDKPFWSWGVGGLIGLLFIIEATMNALLFKDVAGLITAYSLAFSQSFVNIGGCFLVGKFLIGPIGAVPEIKRKIYYAIPLLSYLLFTVWINLTLGLYRAININYVEQLELKPEMANAALQPWAYIDLLDTPSAIVVFVGLVLAALAYLKGLLSDDPYPGYGRMARAAMAEQKKTKIHVENLNQEKITLQKEFSEAREKVSGDIQEGLKAWSKSINLMEKISVDYSALIEDANTIWHTSISSYEEGIGKYLPATLRSPVFDKDKADPNKVFSDAQQYFKTDEERLAELKELDEKTNKNRGIIETKITEKLDTYLAQISEIEGAYPSNAQFP